MVTLIELAPTAIPTRLLNGGSTKCVRFSDCHPSHADNGVCLTVTRVMPNRRLRVGLSEERLCWHSMLGVCAIFQLFQLRLAQN